LNDPFRQILSLDGESGGPMKVEKSVFISYRRSNAPWALAIYRHLQHEGFDVFLDYSNIGSGDFETTIVENIRGRAHFLALLTPTALERCNEPADWFRREIEAALACKRNIVPVLMDGFSFSTPAIASRLTGPLAALARYNALGLSVEYFDAAMARLCERFLDVPLEAVLHPPSTSARAAAVQLQAAAAAAPAVVDQDLSAQEWMERGARSDDPDEQLRCFDEAVRLRPDAGEARRGRAITRFHKGDLAGAQQDFDEAVRLLEDPTEALADRGKLRTDLGDFAGALRDLNEALRRTPNYPRAHYNRGLTYFHQGDIGQARRDFDEAIRLFPDFAEAYYNRSNLHAGRGDWRAALRDLGEAIRSRPDFAEALYNRGVVRGWMNDVDGALVDLDSAIRLRPNDASFYAERGKARKFKGNVKGAAADFKEAARLGRRPET
jgi:tetratricopeptide (TPR) repeat protein